MSLGLYEKERIMAVALLSAIAGESIFLLGPPGTAKSMVARQLKLVFKGAKSFEYLMSRFSLLQMKSLVPYLSRNINSIFLKVFVEILLLNKNKYLLLHCIKRNAERKFG